MNIDWMHDTACCFGYPSDSSRTARKRAGTLGWVELRRASPPPTRNLWHSLAGSRRRHLRHRPRPPRVAGRGATRLGQLGPGGQDNPTATGPAPVRPGRCSLCHLPWAAVGCAHQPLVIGVSWAALDCDGSPARSLPPAPQGEAVAGGARAGAATDGSPLALRAGVAAGPWGRTCHWRVCWAGGSCS